MTNVATSWLIFVTFFQITTLNYSCCQFQNYTNSELKLQKVEIIIIISCKPLKLHENDRSNMITRLLKVNYYGKWTVLI